MTEKDITMLSWNLKDAKAEEAVLAALLREPKAVAVALGAMDFSGVDFFFDHHRRAFDMLLFIANGPIDDAPMVMLLAEMKLRRDWVFGGSHEESMDWVVQVFMSDGYFDHERKWVARERPDDMECECWIAVEAAGQIQQLRARREAAGEALELLRMAQSPSGPAEEIRDGIDQVLGGE